MEEAQEQPQESASQGFCAALLADAPWNAKSFIAIAVATAGGLASWVADFSSPDVARLGGSYLGGFFIGWAFRRFLRMAALIAGGLLAGIAVLENTGWIDLDWSAAETQISHGIAAAHRGAEGLKHILSGYLPSTGAAAAGVFFGFRKK
jgi:uncharacterized membrane protein (Fun14 family)